MLSEGIQAISYVIGRGIHKDYQIFLQFSLWPAFSCPAESKSVVPNVSEMLSLQLHLYGHPQGELDVVLHAVLFCLYYQTEQNKS